MRTNIKSEEVIKAYEISGIKPVFGKFCNDEKCGCAITAMAMAYLNVKKPEDVLNITEEERKEDVDPLYHIRKKLELPEDYDLEVFYEGFDNSPSSLYEKEIQEWKDGYAARQAVVEKYGKDIDGYHES